MADSSKLAELNVEIKAVTKPYDRSIRQVRDGARLAGVSASKGFSDAFKEITRGASQAGRAVGKALAPATGAVRRLAAPHLAAAQDVAAAYAKAARSVAGAMRAALKDSADLYRGLARAAAGAAAARAGAVGGRVGGTLARGAERLSGTYGVAGQSHGERIRAALGTIGGKVLDRTGGREIAAMLAGVAGGFKIALVGAFKGLRTAAPGVVSGLATAFGGLRTILGGVASGFGRALKGAAGVATSAFRAAAGTIGSVFSHVASGVTSAFGDLAKGALSGLGIGAGMAGFNVLTAGIGGAIGAIKSAIHEASNLNETINKVKVTFGDASGTIIAAANEMAAKYGIVKVSFMDSAAGFGLIGQAAKLTAAESARLGVDMAKLAADASSFYNIPMDVALEKMRAGLVGEPEPLRQLGVLLSEEAVRLEAVRMGLVATSNELTQGQRVIARASLITQGLAKANGDLARTHDDLENKLREIQGRFANLAAQIGQYFLPAAREVSKTISGIIQAVSGKLVGGNSVFASWGESLRKAAEFAGMLFRNLDRAKAYGAALLKDIGARVQEAFGWAVNEMMKFADYLAAKISHAIESALSNVLSKLGGVLGGRLGFMMGVVAQDALKPGPAPERPKFEAMPPHQDVPEFAKARGGLVLADLGREVGEQVERAFGGLMGEGAIGKDQAEKFRARARKQEEEDRQRERDEEAHQALTKSGQDFAAAVANRNIGIRAGGELPFGVTKDLDERRKARGKQFELTPAEQAMRDIDQQIKRLEIQAAGKGPEAEKAQDKLKDVQEIKEKQKNDLLAESQERREKAGRSFGLEEFQKEIQQSIFGGGKDPAEKTATGITDLLALLKGVVADGQLKVTGNLVANAAP